MEWDNFLTMAGLLVAVMALLGPALVYLGMQLGSLRQQTTAAHKRIDRLEETLTREFELLRTTLDQSIRDGWKHCPLATKGVDSHGH